MWVLIAMCIVACAVTNVPKQFPTPFDTEEACMAGGERLEAKLAEERPEVVIVWDCRDANAPPELGK